MKRWENDFALLHCNSIHTPHHSGFKFKIYKKLEKIHNLVGYSGHERGIAVSLAAVGLGAKIIERHITLSRTMEGQIMQQVSSLISLKIWFLVSVRLKSL